jgi:hypothetical protein
MRIAKKEATEIPRGFLSPSPFLTVRIIALAVVVPLRVCSKLSRVKRYERQKIVEKDNGYHLRR